MPFYFGKLDSPSFSSIHLLTNQFNDQSIIHRNMSGKIQSGVSQSPPRHDLLLLHDMWECPSLRYINSTDSNLDQLIPFIVTLCLASSISLYPVILIAPALLQFSRNRDVSSFHFQEPSSMFLCLKNHRSIFRVLLVIILFALVSVGILVLNFFLNHQSWSFIDSTYSFM